MRVLVHVHLSAGVMSVDIACPAAVHVNISSRCLLRRGMHGCMLQAAVGVDQIIRFYHISRVGETGVLDSCNYLPCRRTKWISSRAQSDAVILCTSVSSVGWLVLVWVRVVGFCVKMRVGQPAWRVWGPVS